MGNGIFDDEYYKEIAQDGSGKTNALWKEIIYFILIFFICQVLAIIALIPGGIMAFYKASKTGVDFSLKILSDDAVNILSLFSDIVWITVAIFKCRKIEKRSYASMGIIKKGVVKSYIIGLISGFILFSTAVLICILTKSAVYEGVQKYNIMIILIYFLGFMIQGFGEEAICRGYLMVSIAKIKNIKYGIIISSLLFALMHIANPGITVLAFINLFLYGVAASLCFIKHRNIWVIAAIHTVWNFLQGNFYGINVSGMDMNSSVLKVGFIEEKSLINGGAFGAEGGLAVTLVLVVYIIIMILTYKPVKKIEG